MQLQVNYTGSCPEAVARDTVRLLAWERLLWRRLLAGAIRTTSSSGKGGGVDCTRVNGHQPGRRLRSDTGRRQIIHDGAQSGVGFGLQAAVPGSSDKVMNLAIACVAQRPYQGFCLIEMTYPIVATMYDMHRDIPEPINMVENVVVVAVRLAGATEKPAIYHVMD